jgi:hypothetical protein
MGTRKPWTAVGRTIRAIRAMTPAELKAEGWDADNIDGPPLVVVLDDGAKLYAARDPEGNGPGALFGVTPNRSQFRLGPAR